MTAPVRLLVLDQAVGLWGAQRYLLRLAGPMADRGVEMVLAGPAEMDLGRAWIASGLPHVDLRLPVVRSVRVDADKGRLSAAALTREALGVRSVVRSIATVAASSGSQVVHANGHAIHLDAALAARAARRPVVLHLHEEMPQAFGRALRCAALSLASESIAVSRAVRADLPRPLRRRVRVISNGVDAHALRPGPADPAVRASLGAASGDVLLVALTRLDPEKRIEDLVAALLPMRDVPGWHLAVVGETSSYAQYAEGVRKVAAQGLGERVTFAGRREDVAAVLHAGDVVVHAGVIEGMPLGLLEAGACGLPVVAYRVAGVPEAVLDGATGLLAPPMDTRLMGAQIARLVADPQLRRRMGTAARAHVQERHSLTDQADAYAQMVHRLAATATPVRAAA